MSQIGVRTRNIFVSMVTNYLTKKGGGGEAADFGNTIETKIRS